MDKKYNTLSELLSDEAKRMKGFCYSSFPYSCGLAEALSHAEKYSAPKKYTVEYHDEGILTLTKIIIPPMKGSGKRKPFTITLSSWN